MLNSRNKLYNNFDLLRVLFAIFVMVTHSYTLAGRPDFDEPLYRLTGSQINFSFIGLRGFFIISGFLIFQSFQKSSTVYHFISKRVLRIFPALLTISILTVLIVGPALTTHSLTDYFNNRNTLLVFLQFVDPFFSRNLHCLPGTFERNIYGCEVNGSLWTISYEFLYYVGFLFLFLIKSPRLILGALSTLLLVIIFIQLKYIVPYFKYQYYLLGTEIELKAMFEFALFFLLGSLLANCNYSNLPSGYHVFIALFSISLIIILLYHHLFSGLYRLLLAPFILSVALVKSKSFLITKFTGDVSYGMYLSGFLVQQILMSYSNFSPLYLMTFSISISFIYGFFSWRLIEKPALDLKKSILLKVA